MKNTLNIRQRQNGLWQARFYANGRRRSVYGKTKKEAKQKMIQKMNDAFEGLCVDESSVTVKNWMTQYLDFCVGNVKNSTLAAYSNDINRHIIPQLGHFKLKDLTPLHVQKFYKQLQNKGLSPKTIRDIHGVLHGAIDKAVRMDMLKRNVSEYCDLPKKKQKEMHPLTDIEVGKFLSIAKAEDPDFYPIFFIAFFTGLRQCEIVGLTWDCVDFQKSMLHIYRQYSRIEYGPRLGQYDFAPLKNDKERTFSVATQVKTMLNMVRIHQAEKQLSGAFLNGNRHHFVFTYDDGRPISASAIYHHFKKIVTKMGLPQVRFHDARHTYATLAIQHGIDIKTLSKSLGHATTSFTLDVYGHVSDKMQQDMADKMGQLITML